MPEDPASSEPSPSATTVLAPSIDRPSSMTAQPALLAVRDLTVDYGGVRAVGGITLHVGRGEIVGLIGPNGAGKSSALNAISGDVPASGGTVVLNGRDVTRLAAYRRSRLGLGRTFQTAKVFEGLTVYEGLVTAVRGASGASLWQTIIGRGRRLEEEQAGERAWRMLDQAGLDHIADLFGRELSGGQRRFVDLTLALIKEPQMLVLDEPMVGVAPSLVPRLLNQLRSVAAQGTGILIVEHALEVVAALCDRVVVMAAGQVIAQGTYDEIAADTEVRRAYLS